MSETGSEIRVIQSSPTIVGDLRFEPIRCRATAHRLGRLLGHGNRGFGMSNAGSKVPRHGKKQPPAPKEINERRPLRHRSRVPQPLQQEKKSRADATPAARRLFSNWTNSMSNLPRPGAQLQRNNTTSFVPTHGRHAMAGPLATAGPPRGR
jgi:hypothetical protein